MAQNANYIAVDLGAESGRVMLGRVADGRLSLEQMHRFANGPVEEQGSLRWDFDRLMSEIKTGIGMAAKAADGTGPRASASIPGASISACSAPTASSSRSPTTTATAGPTA